MHGSLFRHGRLARAIAVATLVGGSLGAGVAPVVASPPVGPTAPLTITADRLDAVPAGHVWAFNDFFPRGLKVHQGQTIQVAIEGFHTATFLPAGVRPKTAWRTAGLIAPDSDDTAANPNGTSHTEFRLASAGPAPGGCGTAALPCSFTGSQTVSSGVPLGPTPPFAVTMNAKPGAYNLICLVHPGMSAKVVVVPRRAHATTPAQLAATVNRQVRRDVAAGYKAERANQVVRKVKMANGHTRWIIKAGTSSPDGRVVILEFLPALNIHAGDVVTWRATGLNEPHTVTFPGDLETDLVPLCEGTGGAADTPATPGHTPPQGPFDFTCGAGPVQEIELGGGNGVNQVTDPTSVSDSGVIGNARLQRGFGLPATATLARWTVRFTTATPGTYTYVCQIHDGMKGTIVVH